MSLRTASASSIRPHSINCSDEGGLVVNPTTYLETSVISYLVARPSRDLVTLASQQITQQWWNAYRAEYELYISEEVVRECREGDQSEVAKRIAILRTIPVIPLTLEIQSLADLLVREKALPIKARADGVHLASAAYHGAELLLTWNMRHLANPRMLPRIRDIIVRVGLRMPEVCTPQALLESRHGRK